MEVYLLAGIGLIGVAAAAVTSWTLRQRDHALLRIYGPVAGVRWAAEALRPKVNQYAERPGEGRPYPLVKREWAYRASKGLPTTEGFGTLKDLHQPGTHTIRPAPFGLTSSELPDDAFEVVVGRDGRRFVAKFPAMRSGGSFGAFGATWTRAASDGGALLNEKEWLFDAALRREVRCGFLDNTGEGGLAPHHLSASAENQGYLDRLNVRAREAGHDYRFRFDRTATSDGKVVPVPLDLKAGWIDSDGRYRPRFHHSDFDPDDVQPFAEHEKGASEKRRNVIVQIGPALAGYRTKDGQIDWEWLDYVCGLPDVAGVEIKGQQGAKPNDASVVKAAKLTAELRALRGFHGTDDYVSPERLPFVRSGDLEAQVADLVEVFTRIQDLPNVRRRGLVTGYKMTYSGDEFLDLLALHLRRGAGPDYIVVDGAEGGTGAADPVMTDHVGVHAYQGLHMTHERLVLNGVRHLVKIVASGRVLDPGDVATMLCLGADYCNALRGFMFATGCIQSLQCHNNQCPTGITTHHSWRLRGLDPTLKSVRFASYGFAVRAKLAKLARVAGVDLRTARFTLRNLEVVTGIGRRGRGDEVYRAG